MRCDSHAKKEEAERSKALADLQNAIHYQFKDKALLNQALVHPSYSSEMRWNRCESNQRLEFLGDAVLELIVSDYLYHSHPETEEGSLTRMRSSLVFEPALTVCAKDIGLGSYLLLGKGEENGGGREKPSILSDAFESLIGAIFLDGGYDAARRFIYEFIINDIDELSLLHDGKSLIQEYTQRSGNQKLSYETVSMADCPDHLMQFKSSLFINDRLVATGFGKSKKIAEQAAAAEAIKRLHITADVS